MDIIIDVVNLGLNRIRNVTGLDHVPEIEDGSSTVDHLNSAGVFLLPFTIDHLLGGLGTDATTFLLGPNNKQVPPTTPPLNNSQLEKLSEDSQQLASYSSDCPSHFLGRADKAWHASRPAWFAGVLNA